MATNPMQRKANNYLLLGILGTLLVTGTIIVFLFMQLNKLQTEIKTQEESLKKVYVVSKDITSGETVSLDNLKEQTLSSDIIPSNAISLSSITEDTIAKIDLKKGTVITNNMITETDEQTTNDLRKQEYNMVILPTQIESGNYVDVRLRLSTGVDYIVVSKKCIDIPAVDGVDSLSTFTMNMTEAETLVMSNAIIEAYIDPGSLLYVTTYVEPGIQKSSIATYVPSGTVQQLIYNNPNIEQEAKSALITRYNNNSDIRTNQISGALSQYEQDRVDNIEAGVQEQITKAKEQRQAYLDSLSGY